MDMQELLNYATKFLKKSTWKDFALIKFCLLAIGIIVGMAIPKKAHKPVESIAILVFIATYIPLMLKLFRIIDDSTSKEM